MGIREELLKAIEDMREEELEAVWDYVRLLREPEEAEPTAEEREAIARGEYVKWDDFKQELLRDEDFKAEVEALESDYRFVRSTIPDRLSRAAKRKS